MWQPLKTSLIMMTLLTALTGAAYPLTITALAQALFPAQANGSLIYQNDQPVGSALIGQKFNSPGYFHGRPSAAGSDGYDAAASSGSNLGPTSQKLKETVADRVAQIRADHHLPDTDSIPGDLVTASASGLDPHISPAAAYLQAGRVAQERGLPLNTVLTLIDQHTEGRQWGLFGQPRVAVLPLNLALDQARP